MGREIRRVPADWQHPRMTETRFVDNQYFEVETDRYQPCFDKDYDTAARQWMDEFSQWQNGTHPYQQEGTYFWEITSPPDRKYYRTRKLTADEATHYQIYEDVSEGTPVSPVFDTLDALIQWCVAQGYSQHAAAQFAERGWVPSAVFDTGRGGFYRDIESAGID